MYIEYVLIRSHTHRVKEEEKEEEKKNNDRIYIYVCESMHKHTKYIIVNTKIKYDKIGYNK